ncbi:unnamed protein product [Echinostoma caproni]|uniref:Uncharacterized protein n=1 Tax=Echinostoma caproni TaxID=27848 RepID=A0A3P8G223_9TREM|nr:unnamed protein product [Echinostoma caproni]
MFSQELWILLAYYPWIYLCINYGDINDNLQSAQFSGPCFSVSHSAAEGSKAPGLGRVNLAVIDPDPGIYIMPRVKVVPVEPCNLNVRAVGGVSLRVLGKQCVGVRIGGVTVTHEMVLIEDASKVIIGVDLLRRVDAKSDFVGGKLLVGSQAQE